MTHQTKFTKMLVEAFNKVMRCKQLDFVYFQIIVGLFGNKNQIGDPGVILVRIKQKSGRTRTRSDQNRNTNRPELDRKKIRPNHIKTGP